MTTQIPVDRSLRCDLYRSRDDEHPDIHAVERRVQQALRAWRAGRVARLRWCGDSPAGREGPEPA